MNIEKYLKKIDIEKLLNKLGVQGIVPLGNNIQASCPFHEDKIASWGINVNNSIWHCFTCSATGDTGNGNLITLVAQIKDISNKEAIHYLYKFAGIKQDITIGTKMVNRQIRNMITNGREVKGRTKEEEDTYIMKATIPRYVSYDFYYGLRYFKARGINKETLKNHDITFCTKGYYRNRAIIPIYNESGVMTLFEARDITGMNADKVLYPKGAKKADTLYNINSAKDEESVIVVEGIMDALYLKERGFNTVAIYGIEVSKLQERLLSKYFDKVYLAFDGDKEGYRALIKQAKKLSLHLSVYIVTLPKGKDPDDISKANFKDLLDKATEINTYLSGKLFNGLRAKGYILR